MIALDKEALICDFAETYHIYDMESVSVEYAGILAAGLRNDSRIKLKMSDITVSMDTLLLAFIADNTAINIYSKTKDAKTGKNKPKSMVKALLDKGDKGKAYITGADFMAEWNRLNGN